MSRIGRQVIGCEICGMGLVVVLLWVDEWLDLPHVLFGAPATPVNWQESMIESIVVLVLGVGMALATRTLLRRIRNLEGLLSICAECGRIRRPGSPSTDEGAWEDMARYVADHSDIRFSHGLCPECLRRSHPDLYRRLFGEVAGENGV